MIVKKEKTGLLKLFILALTILIVQNNFAQAPAGYYDGATGSGYTLKTQLYNIIKGHNERSYSQLWTDFYSTDRKVNDSVWDMYSDVPGGTPAYEFYFIKEQCGNYGGEGDCYNREHSFPKSWFADGTPMYSDLFHLYPTDGYVNGKRSNYPFGEVGSASWTSTNGSKLGTSNYPGYTGVVFEPIDEYKGDFARTYFYMATRYENVIATWPGSEMLDGTNDQCFTDWALDLLIDWHNNDPVSSKETNRNNAVYSIQNNRNPFIDHPEYVAKIWGGVISNNPPSITGIILNPASPKSTDPVNVSATITDSDGTITSAILKWGLVSGNLSNTINLTKTAGNTYSTVSAIPAQTDGVAVYYKIEATDDSSDVAITSVLSYVVNDETTNTIFFEDFETSTADAPISINNWMRYEEAGTKTWEGRLYNSNKYAQFSAYNSGETSNISWLITPAIDLTDYATADFSFISKDGFNNGEVLTVLISTNYSGTGNPALSTWNNLNPVLASGTSSGYATNFTESGVIDISSYCGNTIFIAYKYVGGDPSKTTTMQIDNISLNGTIATNTSPTISSIEINPESPLVGQDIIVSATITDSDGIVSSAVINYGASSGNYSQSISMTKSGNTFTGTIPSQLAGTTIYFVVKAIDEDSGESVSAEQSFLVTELQNNPPVLSNIQYVPTNPEENQTVTVSVEATDSDGEISYCRITWGDAPEIYSNTVNMTLTSGTYSGTIPGQTGGITIYFKISATDDEEANTLSSQYSYSVNTPGNLAPEISGLDFDPLTPTSTENVIVSATITDPDGTISTAKIKWGKSSGVYENTFSMAVSGDDYSGTIPAQADASHIYFVVEAIDNLGGSTTSAEENYIVQDPANELPVITDVQFSPSNPTNKDSVLVTALINDSDGAISTAILKWKRNAEATVFEKEMSYDGIKYSAYIPVQEAGRTVYFMIIAEDDDNAQTSYMDGVYSVITSSGVENTNLLEEILIYPNPASEKLKIFFLNNERDIVIALLSMDGITIYNKIFDEVKGEVSLMLNKINPGLYILQITNQKSKVSQKIIIK
ncbi:MAG: endonuclease [Bacteroidales bacterium]|jgi:endonuclease I|nr:endonuclease [Bacteroidales bacterium]